MSLTYANVRDQVEQILHDTSNAIWDTTELDYLINNGLYEISEYVPLEVVETVHAIDDSYEIDISGIEGLIEIDKAEWELSWEDDILSSLYRKPFSYNPPRYRNVTKLSESKAMLHLDSRPVAHKDEELTGTVTFADGSKAITGSGTAFLSELEVGDYIKKSSGTEWYRVFKIANDTTLTLAREVITAEDGADSADVTQYWHSPVWLHCWKVHRVNEMTDLAGAVDKASGYADGIKNIDVNGVQDAGTVKKNTTFTIASIDGIYTLTADASIGTGSVALYFYPGLSAAIVNADKMTFETSTLSNSLERLLIDLVAARAALNKSVDFINVVNIGGIGTPDTLGRWGANLLGITLESLRKIATPRMYQDYPRV